MRDELVPDDVVICGYRHLQILVPGTCQVIPAEIGFFCNISVKLILLVLIIYT